ncbi:MAG TPA: hypothetical protein VFT98_19530 [Myxococcota bacterium]|nr:hypothetical protein [Myxococcota bacterium]
MSGEHTIDEEGDLLERLLAEMLQTEQSASEHPRKEAERLGAEQPPAAALLAVADHAERGLPELRAFCAATPSRLGEMIGGTFSAVRDAVTDRFLGAEKSYRGTLLGLQHGIGCAVLTRAVAGTRRRTEVVEFCDRWLDERRPLVDACERQIPWFATHVEQATDRATKSRSA